MTDKNYANTITVVACAVLLAFFLDGCSGKKQTEQQEGGQRLAQQQASEEIPDDLKELEKSMEKIIGVLEGPSVEKETEDKQEQQGTEKSDGQQDSGQQDGEQNKGKSSSENQGENEQNEGQKQSQGAQDGQKQQKDPWEGVTMTISQLHYKWNSYFPAAVKKGADKKLVDGFSTALNSLTDTASKKNKTETLLAVSRTYAYIPDFYSLYRSSVSPELKRIRHYTRNAILSGQNSKWEQAQTDMANLKSTWSLFKNTVQEKQRENADKIELSIYELEKVIQSNNKSLADIKGRITLSNIKELEDAIEEQNMMDTQGQ